MLKPPTLMALTTLAYSVARFDGIHVRYSPGVNGLKLRESSNTLVGPVAASPVGSTVVTALTDLVSCV